jgi:hypothetical protein
MTAQDLYPTEANELVVLLRRIHNALNCQPAYLTKGKKPHINWKAFGESLGQDFLTKVKTSGHASTLLQEPPREFYVGLGWQPEKQTEIADVEELFTRGVCQVRNNIEHVGKFLTEQDEKEKKRSLDLAKDALWILQEAIATHPDRLNLFEDI